MSMWVVLDLLNQFTNTRVLSLFHNRMWQSKYSEVNVHLVQHWLLVTLRETTGVTVLSWCVSFSTLKLLLSSDERVCLAPCAWLASRQTTGVPVLSCLTAFSWKERVSISFERDVFIAPCTWLGVTANNGFPRSIMIWVWIWLVWLGTFRSLRNLSIWSLSNFWTQFFHPVMFQGDLWRRTRWRKHFLVHDFSSFHPNNFRNTISWQCFVKNDSVRSSLIELQFFLQSKIDVDPIQLCSDVSSMHYACIVHDAVHSSRS